MTDTYDARNTPGPDGRAPQETPEEWTRVRSESLQSAALRRYLYKKSLFRAIRRKSVKATTFYSRIRVSDHSVSSAAVPEACSYPAPPLGDAAAACAPDDLPAESAALQDAGPAAQAPSAEVPTSSSAESGLSQAAPAVTAAQPEDTTTSDGKATPRADEVPRVVQEEAGISASIVIDPSDLAEDADTPAESAKETSLSLANEEEEPAEEEEDVDLGELRKTLMALQQQIRAAGIPVVIVFEGWDAAGKGTMITKLIEGLDPRGYQVYPIRPHTETERRYPPMRRYWVKTPAAGNISIFCSSWYREVSDACFDSKAARKRLHQSYNEIVNLESELVCDGVLLIKFFLHISRKEQKLRLKKMESRKNTRWRVVKADWEQNSRYEEYLRLYDAMIARTHFDGMLWHVIRGDNRRVCARQIYETVIGEFRAALGDRAAGKREWDTPFLPHMENTNARTFPQLDTFDPDQPLTDPYKPAVDKAQKQLLKLQNELYRRGIPMVVGFEGWDAAGKGGAIRRLTASLDARGFDVVPIASPTPLEKSHHYLWRFWKAIPENGHIAIFDRTWYGRVMVERIEGYCTEPQWKRAYDEINRFEGELTAHGVILCKFWLHIDKDTQLSRFQDRETLPDKQWKITEEDWRNRGKWDEYETAVNDMLQRTNTAAAPWTVVEANNKQYARLKVLHTVIRAIEEKLDEEKE